MTTHVREKTHPQQLKNEFHTKNSQPLERTPTWVNDEDENAQEPNREGEDTIGKNRGGENSSPASLREQK